VSDVQSAKRGDRELLFRYPLPFWRKYLGTALRERRIFSLVEILAFVIVPPVWGWTGLPRTIFPFFLLGWASLWLRGISWNDVGLRRPASWLLTLLVGGCVAGLAALLNQFVLSPLLQSWGGREIQASSLASLHGNLPELLLLVLATWPIAAMMEEMVFRGYLLNRIIDFTGRRKQAVGAALLVSSLLFSLAHGRYDIGFLLTSFGIGLLEGGLYLAFRRNLWIPILVHGTANTITFLLAFYGLLG
jgi:membrane protease YdiL (CAAX protease family)